ncbi:CDGSH iron-sulfur domain-containing protein [Paenarthrobacter sp. Z7-10]|uniref:CDGSH iron-sulfur domain-containing protein n=1 Tax=Paenarthrobacter sp. Z7-10 TaxID=2787635 RepID=UPI0022A9B0B8|nr:CDGSH iron-sulfur domain-containing protein [Paenarthrobacter sp. Z7-10]MCZ2402983.1 CDGSH iron-sulfur domain-containing protein [Paenarthrobacter sp. Z7-10]
MMDEQSLPQREKEPQAAVVVCPDGPLLIRGDFEIVSSSGELLPRQRKTVALCRCGATGIKPYCDGSHKLIGFRTEFTEPEPNEAQSP